MVHIPYKINLFLEKEEMLFLSDTLDNTLMAHINFILSIFLYSKKCMRICYGNTIITKHLETFYQTYSMSATDTHNSSLHTFIIGRKVVKLCLLCFEISCWTFIISV